MNANAQESVFETELVLSLVCLLSVRNSSESPRRRCQVSDIKKLTHRDKREFFGHKKEQYW